MLRRHNLTQNPPIQFAGFTYEPSDLGGTLGNPAEITPIAGLQAGDLVILVGSCRIATSTNTISNTGGQTWTALTKMTSNQNTTRMFWCKFNGTWSANPSINFSAGTPRAVGMIAFRPTNPSKNWAVDVAISNSIGNYLNVGDVTTITGQTTTRQKTVSVAVNATNGGPTYAGVNYPWLRAGGNHNRSGGGQLCVSFAYRIKNVEGPTGDVVSQVIGTPSLGNTGQSIVTFYES